MQQIMISDVLGRPVLLEQGLSECRFNAGDILKDLSMFSSPFCIAAGTTRDFKGEIELLWYTKPSFLISSFNGGEFEVRVRPVIGSSSWINHTLKNSNLPWLEKVVEKDPKHPCPNKEELFILCLKVLRMQYNL